MRQAMATAALAVLVAGAAAAQTEAPAGANADALPAPGAAMTSGVGNTFFIRQPLEYHMLASDLPGTPVFFDTTTGVGETAVVATSEEAGNVDPAVSEGNRPLGTISDVLLDRSGQIAALVLTLAPEMGAERQVAVAMGLVRMVPGREDPAETLVLLTLDPADLESAPSFEPREEAGDAATPGATEPAAAPEGEPEAAPQGTEQPPEN